MVNVIFREVKEDGSIIAILPSYAVTGDCFLCIANGQIDSLTKDFCFNKTVPTTNFIDLLNELLLTGYNEIRLSKDFT